MKALIAFLVLFSASAYSAAYKCHTIEDLYYGGAHIKELNFNYEWSFQGYEFSNFEVTIASGISNDETQVHTSKYFVDHENSTSSATGHRVAHYFNAGNELAVKMVIYRPFIENLGQFYFDRIYKGEVISQTKMSCSAQ